MINASRMLTTHCFKKRLCCLKKHLLLLKCLQYSRTKSEGTSFAGPKSSFTSIGEGWLRSLLFFVAVCLQSRILRCSGLTFKNERRTASSSCLFVVLSASNLSKFDRNARWNVVIDNFGLIALNKISYAYFWPIYLRLRVSLANSLRRRSASCSHKSRGWQKWPLSGSPISLYGSSRILCLDNIFSCPHMLGAGPLCLFSATK